MSRQQLPPQIRKIEVTDRTTGKKVVRYQLTVDVGADPQTGARRQVRRRYRTEKQARDALSEIGQQAATERFVARKAVTVEELCSDWLASLHNARASTVAGYSFVLAPLREHHGEMAAQKLTRGQLDTLLGALRVGGTLTAKGRPRKPWSPRSLNAAMDAWRLALAYGIERRELAYNPAAGMKKVERDHREMLTYEPAEITKVLRAADKDRNGHLWYLALNGLRRGEIAGLKWSDIDLEAKTLTVARNRVELGGGPTKVVENQPKTRAARRPLPLNDELCSVLKRASARQAGEKLALGAAYTDSGYVAVTEAGNAYTPGAITHLWREITNAAGVKPIRLHDARHSCGTAMHLQGVPLAVIAKWLGHASPVITAQIYAHSQDLAFAAAARTLGAVVTSS
jgi:integrase